MTDIALQKILRNTFTKQDFYTRIGLVLECLEHSAHGLDGGESKAAHCAEYAKNKNKSSIAPYFLEWGEEVFGIFNTENIYNQIRDLKEKAGNLPELVLYVPVDLTGKGIEGVGGFVRERLGENVLIDLVIEPNSLGGCAFVWNGKHYDFSLNHFLEEKRADITSLIKSYDAR